jgi:CRISPR system Cascade subunit CasE
VSYLSQIRVDRPVASGRKLWDSYAWHRAIWTFFPGREDENRNFLFRVDRSRTHDRLLLLSPIPPRLPEWTEGRTIAIPLGFLGHATYRFQVKTNPTKRSMKTRKRVGIYSAEGLTAWLERKAEACGFAVLPNGLDVGPPMAEYFNRKGKNGKHMSVDFKGELEVTHRPDFEHTFYHGIGPAKAFGFGMLMLQPCK